MSPSSSDGGAPSVTKKTAYSCGNSGNLAYKLDLPKIWRIHPVISIAMLEPAPKEEDPYQRPRQEGQPPVTDDPEVMTPAELNDYRIDQLSPQAAAEALASNIRVPRQL